MGTALIPKKAATQTVSATSTSSAITLDGTCPQVQFYNAGPSVAFVRFGKEAQTAVATTDAPIPPGAVLNYTKGDDTHGAIVCATGGTATVYVTPGTGD